MSKIELNTTISDFGWSQINTNFQKIEDEFNQKVFYRDNPVGEPNTINTLAGTDQNNRELFNISSLRTAKLIVNGVDVTTSVLAGSTINASAFASPPPIGGITPNTGAFTSLTVNGVAVVTASGTQTLSNKTLSFPVISQISNIGTITFPTSSDTLVGRNTVDTLTNKTLIDSTVNNTPIGQTTPAAGSFTTLSATGTITPSQTEGIAGTTTNNNAQAGSVGELITNTATATALISTVSANAATINLTAGDWEVSGSVTFLPAATTTVQVLQLGIGTTSATFQGTNTGTSTALRATFTTGVTQLLNTPATRISLAAPATIFLVANTTFGVSTMDCDGFIRARRVR